MSVGDRVPPIKQTPVLYEFGKLSFFPDKKDDSAPPLNDGCLLKKRFEQIALTRTVDVQDFLILGTSFKQWNLDV